ncbi:MAG: hypothetical protein R2825_27525 [Saprospiraceae bacterium]
MCISNLCKYLSLILLFLFTVNISSAQIKFNRQHKFKDGIYLSAMDFRDDSPTIPPEDYTYEEKEKPTLYQRELYYFKLSDSEKYLSEKNIKKIWGICIDGTPYINQHQIIRKNNQDALVNIRKLNDHYTFTQIIMIGAICTITAEGYIKNRDYLNTQYGTIPSQKEYKIDRMMLDLDSGELLDFNVKNLSACIQSDEELFSEFQKDKKKKKKIDEYIVRYNQRNPIYLEN